MNVYGVENIAASTKETGDLFTGTLWSRNLVTSFVSVGTISSLVRFESQRRYNVLRAQRFAVSSQSRYVLVRTQSELLHNKTKSSIYCVT